MLGVEVESDVASADGVTIAGVQSNGPADGVGLSAGDVLTAVDGTIVRSIDRLQSVLDTHKVGDRVDVTWTDRSGETHAATVELEAGPPL